MDLISLTIPIGLTNKKKNVGPPCFKNNSNLPLLMCLVIIILASNLIFDFLSLVEHKRD